MNSNEVLFTKELRLRLTELEYKDITTKSFAEEVKKIYIEETGKPLPANINVIRSKDVKKINRDIPSSYDGTAIHFYSKEKKIDQIYVISQGTANGDDWGYNIRAMIAGTDHSQAQNTSIFVKEAIKTFKKGSESTGNPSVTGISHSLAHNNNSLALLKDHVFDKTYSINGAQTNYYELYNYDPKFRIAVNTKFHIPLGNFKAILKLPPQQLKEFTLSFYKEDATNMYQDISADDPLNAGTANTRGFVTLGQLNIIDTDSNHPGIKSLIDKIPDKDVADLQKIAIQYAEMSEKKASNNEIIQELTGVNMELASKFQKSDGLWGIAKTYYTDSKEINDMIEDMDNKFPPLLEKVKKVTSNSTMIFDELYKGDYISAKQKKVAIEEMNNIQVILDDMEKSIGSMQNSREFAASGHQISILGGDIGSGIRLFNAAKKLMKSFDHLKKALGPAMNTIVEGHSINQMLNAIGKVKNKAYIGQDMILMTGKNQEIKVNVSAAVRMYQEGQAVLTEKKALITQYSTAFYQEVTEDFSSQKQKVMTAINDIEDHPTAHIDLLNKHVFSIGKSIWVESAQVHDSIQPLTGLDISHIIEALTKAVTESTHFLETARLGIQKLFAKDHNVSMLFDYYPGGK
ncbi:hypothetical protein BIV59_18725 [Bacillus sp. MUM 13]|nr:hypothetical protein BIV59_18725 [Bacillus sp. MUM 13]